LLAYALGIPALEVLLAGHATEWLLTIGLVAGYFLTRALSNDAARINVVTDDQRGLLVLDLAGAPSARSGRRPPGRDRADRDVSGEIHSA
jgi:hypothetical protein